MARITQATSHGQNLDFLFTTDCFFIRFQVLIPDTRGSSVLIPDTRGSSQLFAEKYIGVSQQATYSSEKNTYSLPIFMRVYLGGLWHIFFILQILLVDFIGSDGYAGIGRRLALGHDHPQQASLLVEDGAAAVPTVEINVQFQKIMG